VLKKTFMKYDPARHHRRSIRLKGYDYSRAGLYFITICVKNHVCLFGKVVAPKPGERPQMILNDAGKMVKSEWEKLPDRYNNIVLHEYIVMPNHFHGILEIVEPTAVGASLVDAPTVGQMVGAFQSIVTVEYIRGVRNQNWKPFNGKLWQRNYWENIIRNKTAYQNISNYIVNNPSKWYNDRFNPSNDPP
jgi:putative transposase